MVLTVRRQPTTAFRAIGALLAGLTIAEVVWALAYLMAGESSPWIWLVPMAAAAATVVAMWTSANTADRSPAPA
ncbi:MAG TPA: hypothetical protein VJM33_09860 [Microthrixaceae bacterium]|nr:hypothetical protein [Microthrixaceae bacterium]